MKRLDPRSVLIGFLVAVIGFMSLGATDQMGHFDTLEANAIIIKKGGMIGFEPVDGMLTTIKISGLYMGDENSSQSLAIERTPDAQEIGPHSITFFGEEGYTVLGSEGLFCGKVHEDGPVTLIQSGSLELSNLKGEKVLEASLNRQGESRFSLLDNDGLTILSPGGIDVRKRNQDNVRSISDKIQVKTIGNQGKTIIVPGLISIENQRGYTTASLGFTSEGHGALELNDMHGETGWTKSGKH